MEGQYVIVRTYSAGVFAGVLERIETEDGRRVVLTNARRLWYWAGAASISQLAVDGTSKPTECKFPVAVTRLVLTDVIEIIQCSDKARRSIAEVPVWSV